MRHGLEHNPTIVLLWSFWFVWVIDESFPSFCSTPLQLGLYVNVRPHSFWNYPVLCLFPHQLRQKTQKPFQGISFPVDLRVTTYSSSKVLSDELITGGLDGDRATSKIRLIFLLTGKRPTETRQLLDVSGWLLGRLVTEETVATRVQSPKEHEDFVSPGEPDIYTESSTKTTKSVTERLLSLMEKVETWWVRKYVSPWVL